MGYFVPRIARLPERQAIAIGMEIGIHNGTRAIAIASGPLPCSTIPSWPSPPPAIHSLIMFFTAALFGALVSRRAEAPAPVTR